MRQDDEDAGIVAADIEDVRLRKAGSIKTEQFDSIYRAEQVDVAQGKAKVAFWRWIEKRGVPFFSWAVAWGAMIIFLSFIVLGIAYIFYLLGWVDLSRVKEVRLFLADVFTFPSGVASAALVFYLNRKPRR